jgi:hypothetical protein
VVFVSACHSAEAGRAFVAAGVPHVVAVRLDSKVLDKSAMQFSQVFYAHLLAGDTVREAFDTADRTVRASRNDNSGAATSTSSSSGAAGGDNGGAGVGTSEFLLLPEGPHDETVFDSNAPADNDHEDAAAEARGSKKRYMNK